MSGVEEMDNLRNLLDTNSTKRVGPAMRLPFQLCSCIKSQAGILRSRCVIVVLGVPRQPKRLEVKDV